MSNKESINNFIYGLNYNPNEVMKFHGYTTENPTPSKEGVLDDGEYLVTKRTKCSIYKNFDITVPSNCFDVTYPGALVFANDDLVDGRPQALALKRGAAVLTINLPNAIISNNFSLPEVSYAAIDDGINWILNKWFASNKDNSIMANMMYTASLIHDEKEAQLLFGCNADFVENSLGIKFSTQAGTKKHYYLVRYKQVYYTASVGAYNCPADAFAETVTESDLIARGVSDNNPPAYIGSVTYGREFYILFESTSNEIELSAAIEALCNIKGVDVNADLTGKYVTVYNNTQVHFVALGGSASSFTNMDVSKSTLEDINRIIFDNVEFNENTPGYPLNYKVVFLKDNKIADFHGTTEYVTETTEVYKNGSILLEHDGHYVAQFIISWDEITYDENGTEIIKRIDWGQNYNNKTRGYKTTISLNGNCRNIRIKAEVSTGLLWDPWQTIFEKSNIALSPNIKLKFKGTTLNTSYEFDENAED